MATLSYIAVIFSYHIPFLSSYFVLVFFSHGVANAWVTMGERAFHGSPSASHRTWKNSRIRVGRPDKYYHCTAVTGRKDIFTQRPGLRLERGAAPPPPATPWRPPPSPAGGAALQLHSSLTLFQALWAVPGPRCERAPAKPPSRALVQRADTRFRRETPRRRRPSHPSRIDSQSEWKSVSLSRNGLWAFRRCDISISSSEVICTEKKGLLI